MRVRVALLEDNEAFRQRLVQRLEFFPRVEVLFHVETAREFFARLEAGDLAPDVALVDIGLPGASGIDVARRLAEERPAMGVLMLTVFDDPETILAAIQAGAAGYLLKDAAAEEIVEAIVEVHAGGVPLSRPVARQVLHLMRQTERAPAGRPTGAAGTPEAEALSPREIELLEQIVRGDTEAQIADRLCISPHTVRTHVKNIYRKLRVRSRAAAVRTAYERRLLDRPS